MAFAWGFFTVFICGVIVTGMGGGTGAARWLDVTAGSGCFCAVAQTSLARLPRRSAAKAGMLNVSATTRVFVAVAPVDLRGSFNRLFALTQSVLQQDPLSGHWFVFSNRSRNRVKILFWDGSGLWVCAKRLERGRFTWPVSDNSVATLRGEELLALLAGLVVREKQNWFRR